MVYVIYYIYKEYFFKKIKFHHLCSDVCFNRNFCIGHVKLLNVNAMKKVLLSLMLLVAVLTAARAENYAYLTFETTDGAKTSVPVSSLELTFSGTMLTVGDNAFVLSNLNKMYFSVSDETTVTGIDTYLLKEAVEVYDLKGNRVSEPQMTAGVYVVKTKDGNYMIVKK